MRTIRTVRHYEIAGNYFSGSELYVQADFQPIATSSQRIVKIDRYVTLGFYADIKCGSPITNTYSRR